MSEKPSTTLPATVEKIIESSHPSVPEKVQNNLTDKNGDKVRLQPGDDVEVTIEADPSATTAISDDKTPAA
jgi:protein involved in polysaccharide export with SLBB domain